MKTPKIEHISIIAKFDDGACRQILIEKSTEKEVLHCIALRESKIRILEEPIENIDIVFNH
jgi:hypothetical protein